MPSGPLLARAETALLGRREAAAGDWLYERGSWERALAHYQRAVALLPNEADLHYKLAYCAWRAGDIRTVEAAFPEAVRLNPRHAWAHEGLALWHLHRDLPAEAMHHSRAALDLEPTNPDFIVTRAYVLAADGQNIEAWKLLEPVLNHPAVAERGAMLYLRIASSIGRIDEGINTGLKRLQQADPRSPLRPRLHFGLSALFERLGRFDEAFEQARLAHELTPTQFSAEAHRAGTDRQIAFCTRERLASLPRATHGNARPVFVVGMMRSGTSLVEQVLASHSQVFGAGELDLMTRLVVPAFAQLVRGPRGVRGVTAEGLNCVADLYLSQIRSLNSSARYVIDKMPLNFLHLDLVQLLFPDSHVIHCVRDPLDTCISCYLTDFAQAHPFVGSLSDLGSFYRDYRRLTSNWKQVLDVPILDVVYEQMVEDLEGQTRRILDFLGLPWEDQCLAFHKTERPIVTASREQVRKPIYRSSVGRASHYLKHLGPLIDAMGPRRQ